VEGQQGVQGADGPPELTAPNMGAAYILSHLARAGRPSVAIMARRAVRAGRPA
jgi:hypothetical protein